MPTRSEFKIRLQGVEYEVETSMLQQSINKGQKVSSCFCYRWYSYLKQVIAHPLRGQDLVKLKKA
ncbi:hypothetical protein HanIR_Chr01g0049251 [Helianthus annuus]|nr:hypothetical protein HanIR_Chr01g0049251 [Helianthus annuus]